MEFPTHDTPGCLNVQAQIGQACYRHAVSARGFLECGFRMHGPVRTHAICASGDRCRRTVKIRAVFMQGYNSNS